VAVSAAANVSEVLQPDGQLFDLPTVPKAAERSSIPGFVALASVEALISISRAWRC